jgi:hypothetical protein
MRGRHRESTNRESEPTMTTARNKSFDADAASKAQQVLQQRLLATELLDEFDVLDIDEGDDADLDMLTGGAHGFDADDYH